MVGQEQKAIERIKSVHKFIMDSEEVHGQDIYAWAYYNLGVTEKTCAGYLRSLHRLGLIRIDGDVVTNIRTIRR